MKQKDVVRRSLLAVVICLALIAGVAPSATIPGAARIYDGSKTVTAAATAERLVATSTGAIWVDVQCLSANTGNCYVGGSTIADGRGVELVPSQSFHFPAVGGSLPRETYDLSLIWVDVAVNGEGVSFTYARRGP